MQLEPFEALRRRAGLGTRRAAAQFFGVAENTIYRWESGRSRPPHYAVLLLELQAELRRVESSIDRARRSSAADFDGLVRNAFRSMRERMGLTQAELSRRANVSQSVVARFERGKSVSSPAVLSAVLKGLGLDVEGILSEAPPLGQAFARLDGAAAVSLLALLMASDLINAPSRSLMRPARQRQPQPTLFSLEDEVESSDAN